MTIETEQQLVNAASDDDSSDLGGTCLRCGKRRAIASNFDLCMTCINKKHIALRGSLEYLFTRGTREPTCQQACKCEGKHLCYLRFSHVGDGIGHKFSSECVG